MTSAPPDAPLLRRAARTVAVQTALAVSFVVLVMTGAVLVVDEQQQHRQADRVSRAAWATADDVGDPPVGTWLVVVRSGGRRSQTLGAPEAVQGLDPRTLADGASRVRQDGRELAVWTGDRQVGRVSAAYDLGPTELASRRLLASLAVAALIGALGAAAVGLLIGRRAVRPLGEALALQRRFVTDASHELRTPLTVLLTRAQMLRRHLRTDQSAGDEAGADSAPAVDVLHVAEVDQLVRDARVLGDVVGDLLLSAELLNRPQVGEPVDVRRLADDVVASLQPLADDVAVALAVEVATSPTSTSTSAATPAVLVTGAPAALRRALTSLVDNALAHTPPAGHVSVRVRADHDTVELSVQDDGEGLDPALADQVRQRFSRGTSDGAGRRFGLGLALVDEVARSHGGSLDVDGRPGEGARFTLRLPRLVRG